MDTLWHDLRYSARMLWKNSGSTLIATITLALGSIGNCFWMPGREDNEWMWKVSSILPSIGEASESGALLELQTS